MVSITFRPASQVNLPCTIATFTSYFSLNLSETQLLIVICTHSFTFQLDHQDSFQDHQDSISAHVSSDSQFSVDHVRKVLPCLIALQ